MRGEIRSGRNRETETKNCGRHVRVTSETAIGHREKRNQLFKEHNRLLRISASPFGYVTSEIVGVVERKLNGFSCRVHHDVIALTRSSRGDEIQL